jgi:NTE family protein
VLTELLGNWRAEHELVGISGTSGGAFNALAAWYGIVTEDAGRAIELIDAIWEDLRADDPLDLFTNNWVVGLSRMDDNGLPLPRISPYQSPGSGYGAARIRRILERHIDFDALPTLCDGSVPELVVGTVDVNAGEFVTFVNEAVTPQAVLASAAVPRLFEAVEIGGDSYWDGLFSQNPPIDDLLTVDAERKPDELWVIQVNPQRREETPTEPEGIADRRNELAGNISLNQELKFIERVNRWIDAGHLPETDFSRTEITRITMDRRYPASSKTDRSPSFLDELMEYGTQKAAAFRAERQ